MQKCIDLNTQIWLLNTIQALRWQLRWGPPLPIPNREVKTTRADGTGVTPGRVSRRPIINWKPCEKSQGFFVFMPPKDFFGDSDNE